MADIAVLGAGSWGTALSVLLAQKGLQVSLWGRDDIKTAAINKTRENLHYLPGVTLPEGIHATSDLEEALQNVKYILLSVPSQQVRGVCAHIKDLLPKRPLLINTAKGIETTTLKRLSQVISEELALLEPRVCVLSGPSHAEEVGKRIPTAVVAGASARKTAEEVQDLFMTNRFRVYTNPDLIGIELGGALKNVIALGTGIADGLGYGDNSKAALITRGVAEITRLGMVAGANPLTFAGLTGIGDLIVTCTSMHSRNRRCGILLGKGIPMSQAVAEVGMVVEGIKATEAAYALAEQYQVAMPIARVIHQVLFDGKHPLEGVTDLMTRGKTHEMEEVAQNADW